jgi:hypothetical protein
MIRALTLQRPWPDAFLAPTSPKTLENRDWAPPGLLPEAPGKPGEREMDPRDPLWLAIHAGKSVDSDALDLLVERWPDATCAVAGELVALGRVARVYEPERLPAGHPALSDPWLGSCCFAWQLEQVQPLEVTEDNKPLRLRGKLGLWKLPPEVEQAVALAGPNKKTCKGCGLFCEVRPGGIPGCHTPKQIGEAFLDNKD